jgi:UDP-MurNAc hydroxylase
MAGVTDLEFQTLSHAGLQVRAGGQELLCDPWLIGSCYWRSWWNYPPVPKDLIATLRPDFIYLTHIHWDHFQAPSLRQFSPDIPIIVPYDRYDRMVRDLKAIGRHNIIELKHGERLELNSKLAIRSYHFSPFITDSALVIEADGLIILNANDAKLAGGPLQQLLKTYPDIDFCLRSHSSANSRSCFHIIGEEDISLDNNQHYLDAFVLFMKRVRPRYAIPFASNNCLLHEDNFGMNQQIQTPLNVCDYFKNTWIEEKTKTEIVPMIPGDHWSLDHGFYLQEHDYFTNRNAHLSEYQKNVSVTMKKQADKEKKVSVSLHQMERFFYQFARDVPSFLFWSLRKTEFLFIAKSGENSVGFAVNAYKGTVRKVEERSFQGFQARLEFPAIILMQSIQMNMFGHAAISKRVRYYSTIDLLPKLRRFVSILGIYESEILPITKLFSRRSLVALLPRWREGLLYARTAFELLRGRDLPSIERKLLSE